MPSTMIAAIGFRCWPWMPEPAILAAQHRLGRAGFYVEPSSAVAFAAAQDLGREGVIATNETAVVLLTGSGLKT